MLEQSSALAPIGRLAAQVRERLDGSGYPRALPGSAISRPARILGVADAYQAMREPRPHRPALDRDEAAQQLRAEIRAGRLDAEACIAVLAVAGHRTARAGGGPDGLTAHEVEVLRLLARGQSNKQMAATLGISARTAGTHVENIYAKIRSSNRAEASVYAARQGLLPFELTGPETQRGTRGRSEVWRRLRHGVPDMKRGGIGRSAVGRYSIPSLHRLDRESVAPAASTPQTDAGLEPNKASSSEVTTWECPQSSDAKADLVLPAGNPDRPSEWSRRPAYGDTLFS